jgi:outer membrane protein assembly factor BamD (BamD/ComL family)
MRIPQIVLALLWLITAVMGQEKKAEGPTNEKAQKTYKEGFEYLHHGMTNAALDAFKKADKQDSGLPATDHQVRNATARVESRGSCRG